MCSVWGSTMYRAAVAIHMIGWVLFQSKRRRREWTNGSYTCSHHAITRSVGRICGVAFSLFFAYWRCLLLFRPACICVSSSPASCRVFNFARFSSLAVS